MMHLTKEQFSAYADRTLGAVELLWVDDHLDECAICREELSSVLQAWGGYEEVNSLIGELTSSAAEDWHLDFTQLAGYVDRHLDEVEQEIVASHLQICHLCQTEVEDLQAFKQTLSPPAFVPATAVVASSSRWQRFLALLRPARWLWPLATAAAGVVLLAIWFYGQKRKEPVILPTNVQVATSSVPASPVPDFPSPPPQPTAAPSAEEQIVQTALTKGHLEIPAAAKTLRARGGNLMSGKLDEQVFTLLSPQGVMTESERPTLQWTSLAEAKQYTVTVADQNDNIVAESPALTATQWVVTPKLERGRTYLWQVVATTATGKTISAPAPSAPEARFMVLSAESLNTMRRARAQYADSPVALGILYARVGLLTQAEQELRRAGQQPIARRLLKDLQRQLRRPQ